MAQVATWADANRLSGVPATWRVTEDADGSLFLLPLLSPEPAFAIMRRDADFDVLVCDPESMDELGPFPDLATALAGVAWWLNLPQRSLEPGGTAPVGLGNCHGEARKTP